VNRSVPEGVAAVRAAEPVAAQEEDAEAPAAGPEGLELAAQARAVAAEGPVERVEPEAPGAPVAKAEREGPEEPEVRAVVKVEQEVEQEVEVEVEERAGREATTITRTRIR
jgi:CelD/BcsL family acetyltransferase involved in cellulose biosynthesis